VESLRALRDRPIMLTSMTSAAVSLPIRRGRAGRRIIAHDRPFGSRWAVGL
jgi:hypothetical protein